MAAQAIALFTRRLHQGKSLEEQHRKDTRHQVKDDASRKRKEDGREIGHTAGGAGALGTAPRCRHLSGRNGSRNIIGLRIVEPNDAVKLCRQLGQLGRTLDAEANAVGQRLSRLVGSVGDLLLVEGVELGLGLTIACDQREDKILFAPENREPHLGRQRLRDQAKRLAKCPYRLG